MVINGFLFMPDKYENTISIEFKGISQNIKMSITWYTLLQEFNYAL